MSRTLARSGRESRRQTQTLRFRASFLLPSKHGYFNLKCCKDGLDYSELDKAFKAGIIRGTTDDLSSKPEEGLLWLIDFADNAKQTQLGERVILSDEPKVTWTLTSAAIAFGSKGDIYIADVLNMADRVIPRPNEDRKKTYPGYFADYFHSPSYAPNKEALAIGNVYDVWLYDVKSEQFTHLYSPSKELRPGKEMFWLPSIVWSHNSEFLVVLQHKLIHKLIMPSQNPESFSLFRHNPEGFSQRTRMVYVEGLAVIV